MHIASHKTVHFLHFRRLTVGYPIFIIEKRRGDSMEFSLWNFKDWYEKQAIDLSYMISENTATISMLATTDHASEDRLGCALVQSSDTLEDCSGFHTVLCYGRDRILFPVASAAQVLDIGNLMIDTYTDWENRLFDAILQGCSAPALLEQSQELFPFPMAFFLSDGTPLFQTADWPDSLCHIPPVSDHLRPSQYAIRGGLHTIFNGQPYTILSEPICFNDTVLGTLIACESHKKFQPGDIHIFHALCDAMQSALSFQPDALTTFHPLADWFTRCIQESTSDGSIPTTLLKQIGWLPDAYYAVACILPMDSTAPLAGQTSILADSDHCCVTTQGRIFMLVHQHDDDLLGLRDRLCQCFPESEYSIGISLPFHALANLSCYCKQAIWSVQQAQVTGQNLVSIHTFLPQAIRRASQMMSQAQSLIHPDIQKLALADLSGSDCLVQTLFIFLLHGCSISRTADVLFIHRNTLRTRLKKIASIIPVNWEDSDLREQYLISLRKR